MEDAGAAVGSWARAKAATPAVAPNFDGLEDALTVNVQGCFPQAPSKSD